MASNEQELIQNARAGDETAMEALFRLHVNSAVRLAYLICGNWPSAEDTVQEAFIRAFRSLNTFRDGAPFAPWFTRIVVNLARNERRRARPFSPLQEAEGVETGASPEEMVLVRERRRQLLAALDMLDDKHRLPVLLKYFSGISEAETAEALGLPVSTVKSRLHTARRRLKETLSLREEGGF